MPGSAVWLVRCSVSTIHVLLLLLRLLLVYGGEAGRWWWWCRVVCHFPNAVSSCARLGFIVDESLGIDPAVEVGGIAEPFHQSFLTFTNRTAFQYRFNTVHFIKGYRHLLQLQFVEGTLQHFAEIVPQAIHGWVGGVNLVYREQLFAPVRLVALFERAFVLADTHAIRHAQLGHALTIVTVQTLPHLFLVLCIHL